MEFLKQLLANAHLLIPILIAFNFLMSGIHGALEALKDVLKGDADEKINSVVVKIIAIVQNIIDMSVGNKEHK